MAKAAIAIVLAGFVLAGDVMDAGWRRCWRDRWGRLDCHWCWRDRWGGFAAGERQPRVTGEGPAP
jgi:hypothetical protein